MKLSLVAVVALGVVSLAACTAESGDGAGTSDQAVVEDVLGLTPIGDGQFKAVCRDPSGGLAYDEVVTADQVRTNDVCKRSVDIVKAFCAKTERCTPNTYRAMFATDEACIAQYSSAPGLIFPGLDGSCALKFAAAACGEIPKECEYGTAPNGAACNYGQQCASGDCAGATEVGSCGTCKAAKKEGEACGATSFKCGAGLRCNFGSSKCEKNLVEGSDCSAPADAFSCTFPLTCLSDTKKCSKAHDIGGKCSPITGTTYSQDCLTGLQCVGDTCQDVAPAVKELGAACGVGDTCKGGVCLAEKCAAFAKSGEACALDGTKPFCGSSLECKDGKCKALTVCK